MEQLGKYGFLRRDYLKNHRNSLYQVMLLQDTIGEHLLEVDKAAREREEVILKPRITENGIDYILVGDYYIPDLKLPEEHRPIGKYGRMHREYLREVHPAKLNTLTLTGELWTYLADLNEQAQERLDTIMEQMKDAEGVTEELKRTQQMEWVRRCNNIHNRAEEIILQEMIYS